VGGGCRCEGRGATGMGEGAARGGWSRMPMWVKEPPDLRPRRSRAHPRVMLRPGVTARRRGKGRWGFLCGSQLVLTPGPPPHWRRRRGRAEVQHSRGSSWHAGVKMPRRRKGAEGTSRCGKGPEGTGGCGRELMRCPFVPDVLIRALPIQESLILAFLAQGRWQWDEKDHTRDSVRSI
jgi:hypothetical protein